MPDTGGSESTISLSPPSSTTSTRSDDAPGTLRDERATEFVSVCTVPAFDMSDARPYTIDSEEEMIIVDTDANLVPLVNIIKQGLAQRLVRDADACNALNACIHSSHDSSSMIVGLCMAMWTMACIARVRANRDLFEMMSVVCSIVPWRHVAVTKQVYKSWMISVFKTIIVPFSKIPHGVDGDDGLYIRAALEYFKRVDFFRQNYTLVGGDAGAHTTNTDDYEKMCFYSKIVSKFDLVGSLVVDMAHHYITLAHATSVASTLGLEKKKVRKTIRGRHTRRTTTTQFLHPFVRADDTPVASFARAIVFFAAHYRLKAIVVGYQARRWVKRLKAQRLADQAMVALVAKEEAVARRQDHRIAARARKVAAAKAEAAARRAYTLRVVWEPKSRLDRELVMRMEIDFPSNSASCNTEDVEYAPVLPVLRMIRERWLLATAV